MKSYNLKNSFCFAFCFVLFVLFPTLLFAQNLTEIKTLIETAPSLQGAQVSYSAKYIGGKKLLSKNEKSLLVPASLLKLFTTATSLDILGADKTFETKIYLNGKQKGSRFIGDVFIVGAGDPTLGSARFKGVPILEELLKTWALVFKEAGIKKIKGNIYADNSLFSGVLLPWRTSYQNIGNYYAAPADALSARDNIYEIHFSSATAEDTQANVSKIIPQVQGLSFKSYVSVSTNTAISDVFANFAPDRAGVNLVGAILPSSKEQKIFASIPNPALFLAQSFLQTLQDNDIDVSGIAEVKKFEFNEENQTPFITYKSPTIAEIVKFTNKRSFNLYADVLLRDISAYTGGKGNSGDGIKKEKEFLTSINIPETEYDIYDGSGLSMTNNLTCNAIITLLEKIIDKPYKNEFLDSLSVAGNPKEKGTMSKRLKQTSAEYNALIKTGTLDKAKNIAGYVNDSKGKQIAFCFMVNNFKSVNTKDINILQEAFITSLSDIGLNKKPKKKEVKHRKKQNKKSKKKK